MSPGKKINVLLSCSKARTTFSRVLGLPVDGGVGRRHAYSMHWLVAVYVDAVAAVPCDDACAVTLNRHVPLSLTKFFLIVLDGNKFLMGFPLNYS